MTNSKGLQGGCLCGEVRYEIAPGSVFDAGWCHCRQCQRMTGSGALAFFNIKPVALGIAQGTPRRFQSSDQGCRVFCGSCGSPLWYQPVDPEGHVAVCTGTLDQPEEEAVHPRFHMFEAERLSWCDPNPDLPRFVDNKLTHPNDRPTSHASAKGRVL